jgi:hypothetical protein
MSIEHIVSNRPDFLSKDLTSNAAMEAESLWDIQATLRSYGYAALENPAQDDLCRYLHVRLPDTVDAPDHFARVAPALHTVFRQICGLAQQEGLSIPQNYFPQIFTINYAEEFERIGKHRDKSRLIEGGRSRSYVASLAGEGDFVVYSRRDPSKQLGSIATKARGIHSLENPGPYDERYEHDAVTSGEEERITAGFQIYYPM